ncbi:response regulator transcription factor [Prosthecomicrobium sp. N25]|uniref:response regulator transcription factor n=1 Tax=Prosthecomicrobium sp. N25 TaxID=3129254 RepID=UPI0030779038
MSAPEPAAPGVHVVDDDPAVRDSLGWLFRTRGLPVTVWDSGEAFLAAWRPGWRGCVVLDVRMTGLSGLDVLDRLKAQNAAQPVIVLTGHGDVPIAVQALKNGAHDFLEKPFDADDLVGRVVAALELESRRHDETRAAQGVADRLASLSAREQEVLDLLLAGLMNKQIADRLGITMRTVEVHRARILEKFGVRSAVELAHRIAKVR